MNVEFTLNRLGGGQWWFDLGISYQRTQYHTKRERLFAIGFGIATLYIRW